MTANRKKDQKGPQRHAEGQQGDKTHAYLIDTLHGKHGGSPESEGSPQRQAPEAKAPPLGREHLTGGRQQHDEAELASEYNRTVEFKERNGETIDGPSIKGGKAPGHGH
jgi:hypothetical protein